MPPSLSIRNFSPSDWLEHIPEAWRAPLARLLAAWLLLFAMTFADWRAMAGQWWDSSTYNHILLIPAILGWFVVTRARQLSEIRPEAWWPALAGIAAASMLWLLGAVSGLDAARQLGAVLLMILSVPLLLGARVAAALAFPLCYAVLLVPFGDVLVPTLQMVTADITIALVHLSGIPATIDGVFIDTPAGLFEVAEACSGVKFLIAMLAFGLLVANVCFLSWRRRLLFVAACLVIPILANGVRAWGTVYAAQIFGIEAAAGFDHIVYGWLFFALVLVIVIAGGWRYFDRPADATFVDADAVNSSAFLDRLARYRASGTACLAGLLLIVAGSHAWARAANGMSADLPDRIALPAVQAWQRVDYAPQAAWEPRATGADHRLLGRYQDAEGRTVDVFYAVWSSQGEGRDAGGFGEGALTPESGWSWLSAGPVMGNGNSERLRASTGVERLAVTWYRTGNVLTGSNGRLKLANMADRLLLQDNATAMLILSAEEAPGRPAAESIERFRNATGPLDAWMDRVAGLE